MGVVTVTGNAWDHTGAPIPASNFPELWFRPLGHDISAGSLLVGVEAKANLNLATGAFTVDLMAEPWIRYRPVLRWLVNPLEPNPEMWSWGYAEWDWTFNPFPSGGPISDLDVPDLSIFSILVGLTYPPGYKGWWLYSPAEGEEMPLDDPDIGDLKIVS